MIAGFKASLKSFHWTSVRIQAAAADAKVLGCFGNGTSDTARAEYAHGFSHDAHLGRVVPDRGLGSIENATLDGQYPAKYELRH